MKYLSVLIILLLLSSCCGTKRIVENTPEITSKEITQVITPVNTNIEEVLQEPKVEIEELTPSPKHEDIIKDIVITEAFNHNTWNDLLQNHVSKQGDVNYKAFKSDVKTLRNYITSLGENIPTDNWSKEDKLAYWINAYNAMTIDLIVRNYPIKSIKDIDKPWDQRLWKIGSKWYNLNEIEHKILRKMNEPRIHFAIVCASFSCPKLQNEAFTASHLEKQLTNTTKEFLLDSDRNNISQDNLKISKIFSWFAKDFKKDGSLIDFLNKYSGIKISEKAKKSFKVYNWDLNE